MKLNINFNQPVTACKQYCLAAGAIQGKIAYTPIVMGKFIKLLNIKLKTRSHDKKLNNTQQTQQNKLLWKRLITKKD